MATLCQQMSVLDVSVLWVWAARTSVESCTYPVVFRQRKHVGKLCFKHMVRFMKTSLHEHHVSCNCLQAVNCLF